MGQKVRENLPNMGVTAHRYILQVVSNEQKLKCRLGMRFPVLSRLISLGTRQLVSP